MKSLRYPSFIIVLFLFFNVSYAWDSLEHQVIAQIAYDQLSPAAKNSLQNLLQVEKYHSSLKKELFLASTYPDYIRKKGVTAFNSWHYINLPYPDQGISDARYIGKENVVWAINQSMNVLMNKQSPVEQKRLFLKFLIHFVGDVHQPFHCFTQVINGQNDGNGNGFILSGNYQNLHQLWDDAGGLLQNLAPTKNFAKPNIQLLADKIEEKYPKSVLQTEINIQDPEIMAKESYTIAAKSLSEFTENHAPSAKSLQMVQTISTKQLALAGYRLGNMLNQLYIGT